MVTISPVLLGTVYMPEGQLSPKYKYGAEHFNTAPSAHQAFNIQIIKKVPKEEVTERGMD